MARLVPSSSWASWWCVALLGSFAFLFRFTCQTLLGGFIFGQMVLWVHLHQGQVVVPKRLSAWSFGFGFLAVEFPALEFPAFVFPDLVLRVEAFSFWCSCFTNLEIPCPEETLATIP